MFIITWNLQRMRTTRYNESMKISVVIPAYNEEKYLEACLDSLQKQVVKPDEIIVVDNNSTDTTAAIAKSFGVRLIKEKKQGMIFARNKGFNSAKYDIIARTDADARVPKDWIKRIKNAFTQDKKLSAYAGAATFYKIPKVMQPKNWLFGVWFEPFKLVFGHDCLFGPNMALRKSAWNLVKNKVCLEDKLVHEDMDLSYHIGRIGKIKFDSKLVVKVSPRKFKKIHHYLEYGSRNLKTIQHHRDPLIKLNKSKEMMRKVLPRTKHTLKKVAATVRHPLRYL